MMLSNCRLRIYVLLFGLAICNVHAAKYGWCQKPALGGCPGLGTNQTSCLEWSGCVFASTYCTDATNCDLLRCGLRNVTMGLAQKILPSCVRGDQKGCDSEMDELSINMKLSTECGVSDPIRVNVSTLSTRIDTHFVTDAFEPSSPEAANLTVFVDSVNGSDLQDGSTREFAVRTISRAMELIRGMANNGGRTIVLMTGTHRLDQTITLTSADSGITFQGETGAVVTAAMEIKGLNWTIVDPQLNISAATLPSDVLDGIGPLTVLAYKGEPMVRSRWPNKASYLDTVFAPVAAIASWTSRNPTAWFSSRIVRPVLWGRGLSRYRMFTFASRGSCFGVFNPPAGYFCNPQADADGGCAYSIPAMVDLRPSFDGVLRKSSWTNWGTGYFHTKHPYKWGAWTFQLAGPTGYRTFEARRARSSNMVEQTDWTNTDSSFFGNTASQSNATSDVFSGVMGQYLVFARGGFQEARGDCGLGGGDWYVENIRQLVDFPKEYFLSFADGMVYFVPPTGEINVDPDAFTLGAEITRLFEVLGNSSANPVRNVKFQNIRFESTYPTHMDTHETPSGGDWALHRGGALFFEHVEDIVVADCRFVNLGSNAIFFSKHAWRIDVLRNSFFGLDGSAILLSGDPKYFDPAPWDRRFDTDYVSNVTIRNNHIRWIGLMEIQAAGVFGSITRNILIERNIIYHGPRAAIVFNDLFGDNHITRLNIAFDMVLSTLDHGPYNVWDRQQWLLPPGFAARWNIVENNIFFGSYSANKIVDLDDGSRDHIVRNNLMPYGYAKFKGGNHMLTNNLIYALLWSQGQCVWICASHQKPAVYRFMSNVCMAIPAAGITPYAWDAPAASLCTRPQLVTTGNRFFGALLKFGRCGSFVTWHNRLGDRTSLFYPGPPTAQGMVDLARNLVNTFPV